MLKPAFLLLGLFEAADADVAARIIIKQKTGLIFVMVWKYFC
jgi:hypothetical protein